MNAHYIANIDYRLATFKKTLNRINNIQCARVTIFYDEKFSGYPKYFALNISHVESNMNVNVNKKPLLVRIEESDSKLDVHLMYIILYV